MTANGLDAADRDAPLPGARTALLLLLAINLINYIDRYVLSAVVPHIRDDFFPANALTGAAAGGAAFAAVGEANRGVVTALLEGLKNWFGFDAEYALIGLLALAFMAAYMVLAPLFGWLADRVSRWWLVGVGVVLWSLATGASGLSGPLTGSFLVLLLTRCLVGVGEAAYGPVAPTMISDLYPVRRRGSVLAWFYMAIPVGSALGFALGGLIAGPLGLHWSWAFYVVVPPGILLGLWCFALPEPPRGRADAGAVTRRAGGRDYLILLKTPSYVLDTLGMTAMTFAVGGIAFWMPDYVHTARHGGDLGTVNLIFGGIVVVTGLAATLLGGIVGDRLRERYPGSYFLVSGVAMLLAFPFFLVVLVVDFPWAWLFVFLSCFCLFFNTGPTNTILANVTHPSIRATGFALNIFVIHALGDAISPLVIGVLRGAYHDPANPARGMNVAFGFVSALILLGGVLWLWGARYLARDTERAPRCLDPEAG